MGARRDVSDWDAVIMGKLKPAGEELDGMIGADLGGENMSPGGGAGDDLAEKYRVSSPVITGLWSGLACRKRCKNVSGCSPELLLSGVMRRYASREKKRTLCPVAGVFLSRSIDRTEPPAPEPRLVGSIGV